VPYDLRRNGQGTAARADRRELTRMLKALAAGGQFRSMAEPWAATVTGTGVMMNSRHSMGEANGWAVITGENPDRLKNRSI
jgi:hypothetical protein